MIKGGYGWMVIDPPKFGNGKREKKEKLATAFCLQLCIYSFAIQKSARLGHGRRTRKALDTSLEPCRPLPHVIIIPPHYYLRINCNN